MRMRPQTCHGVIRWRGGVASWVLASRRATVAMKQPCGDERSGRPRGAAGRSWPLRARDLLDAGDHLVDGLVDGDFLAHDAVRGLGPDVLVVEHRELVVLGELERHRAGLVLLVDRLAVAVRLPERPLLAGLGDREPAPERALDVRRQVLFLEQEADELFGLRLVLRLAEDRADLHGR